MDPPQLRAVAGSERHFARAVTLHRSGRLVEALEAYRLSLTGATSAPAVLDNMGVVLAEMGRLPEAIEQHRLALRIDPGHFPAMYNLGIALMATGDPEGAERWLRRTVAMAPDNPEGHRELGMLLAERGESTSGAASLAQALALAPARVDICNALANTLADAGATDAALAMYDRALELDPHEPAARWNRGLLLLSMGEWERGWQDYAARKRLPEYAPCDLEGEAWTGDDPRGRTLLLYSDQGAGDAIQFVRFARELTNRGARVIVQANQHLAPLLGRADGVAEVVAMGDALPSYDGHAALSDLPLLCGATPRNVAAPGYIKAPNGDPPLDLPRAPRIGIQWRGSTRYARDSQRSLPLRNLRPLLELEGVRWVSLQLGSARAELDELEPEIRARVTDAGWDGREWEDTARIISRLDLVIAVDTAAVHVAGALGVPAWVLLSSAPDYRWMRDVESSPWYPAARLFRQRTQGEWSGVVAGVRDALSEWLRDRPTGANDTGPAIR